MGKKGWFSAVKKAISPSISKNKKEKRSHKSKSSPKKPWHRNQMSLDTCSSPTQAATFHQYHTIIDTEFKPPEIEEIKHVDTITYIVEGKTREEIGAIKIQTAYRGYMARRAFRSLRAMMRLNLWLQGQAVKRQTTYTLIRIQTIGRVNSQVRARKTRMAEVNETLQRQLLHKPEKLLKKHDFDLSPKSKEQVEAALKSKKEAAERREKALAYAYSRQQTWRNSQQHVYLDPNDFDLGWSWSSRWNKAGPWETGFTRCRSPPSNATSKALSPRSQIFKPRSTLLRSGSSVGLAIKRHLMTNSPSACCKSCPIVVR